MADGTSPAAFRPIAPKQLKEPLNLPQLLWQTWRDPLTIYHERQFQEPFVYSEGPLGAILNVTAPEGVKHVLLDNAKNYDKGDFQRRLLGPMVTDGLFLADGEQWRKQRRLMAPMFTPTRLAGLAQRMLGVCERRIATWPRTGVVEIDREMTGITFEIISDILFSNMLGGEAADFERGFNSFVETAGRISPLDLLGAPQWIPRLNRMMGAGATAFFEQRVAKLVADRRAMIESGKAPDDLLTALLNARDDENGAGLTEHEVLANVLTFIIAGHETTARALGWTLYLLARTPHYQAHLHTEADGFDLANAEWQASMPWTRAALDESMRLFPPAPTTLRIAHEADVVCGQAIPAGAMVVISPWLIQRHRKRWDDPSAFKPERFLPGAREKIDRFAYIPFSGGPRICIGAAFAIQEAMIALAVILRRFDVVALGDAEAMPTQRLTLRAKGGIRLAVRERSRSA
jgi:cytochrome P450